MIDKVSHKDLILEQSPDKAELKVKAEGTSLWPLLRLKTKSKEMRALSFFVAENDEKKEEIR